MRCDFEYLIFVSTKQVLLLTHDYISLNNYYNTQYVTVYARTCRCWIFVNNNHNHHDGITSMIIYSMVLRSYATYSTYNTHCYSGCLSSNYYYLIFFYFVHYERLEWVHIFSELDCITLDIKINVNHSTTSTTLVEHKRTRLDVTKSEKYIGTRAMTLSMR